jgi:hypothetical protein
MDDEMTDCDYHKRNIYMSFVTQIFRNSYQVTSHWTFIYIPFQRISGHVYVCFLYRLCLCYNNFLVDIWNCSEDIYIVLSFYFTLSYLVFKEWCVVKIYILWPITSKQWWRLCNVSTQGFTNQVPLEERYITWYRKYHSTSMLLKPYWQ